MPNDFSKELSVADIIRKGVLKALAGDEHFKYSGDRRNVIILRWLNLAVDHHAAICLLVQHELYGAALALQRAIFEILYKAHWVALCATNSEVDEIATKTKFDYPVMDSVATDVDAKLSRSTFKKMKDGGWKILNDYTHSGFHQSGRQMDGLRISASYEHSEIATALFNATGWLLAHAELVAEQDNRAKLPDISNLIDEYDRDFPRTWK